MKMNLIDYVGVYKNHINKSICEETVKQLNDKRWVKHEYAYGGGTVSYEDDLQISYDNVPTKKIIMDSIWDVTNQYVTKDLNCEWYSGWNGFSEVRFNRYDENTQMRKHCDHIKYIFDGERKGIPTLTILACLNNDYTGGDLILFDDEKIQFNAGDVVVFPSNFLYPHRITPITKGVRYSCVSWVW
jgi:predicted 2-oxoglutarate/Fe(II)-dependent dioxygenase YbiX